MEKVVCHINHNWTLLESKAVLIRAVNQVKLRWRLLGNVRKLQREYKLQIVKLLIWLLITLKGIRPCCLHDGVLFCCCACTVNGVMSDREETRATRGCNKTPTGLSSFSPARLLLANLLRLTQRAPLHLLQKSIKPPLKLCFLLHLLRPERTPVASPPLEFP